MIKLSLEQKINEVMSLAVHLGYDLELQDNIIWNLIDFGYDHEFNIINGKCSLQASLDFNMEVWEQTVDDNLNTLNQLKAMA